MKKIIKPPLGIIPKDIYYEHIEKQRLLDLCSAISRYYNACLAIRVEWIEEYNELIAKYGGMNNH